MKFTALVENNDTTVTFDVSQRSKRELKLEKATVYWRFKNILTGVNDVVEDADNPGTQITRLTDGYWNFRSIQSEFKSKSITLLGNEHNGKCSIKCEKKALRMGKLGVLLGFAENHLFLKDDWNHSPNMANINHGFKYLKISVDAANEDAVYDESGRRSRMITTLDIDTSQALFGTRTHYPNIMESIPITHEFGSLRFTITSNIDWPVAVDATLCMKIS